MLAYTSRTMVAVDRRFWYISRERNRPSLRTCEHTEFKFVAHMKCRSLLGIPLSSRFSVVTNQAKRAPDERLSAGSEAENKEWYARYYSRMGTDRNDLKANRGVLFQTLASERSVVRAFHEIPLETSGMRVLDIGCGSGASWYQLFRLGVKPRNTVGIDIQLDRLAHAQDLYPQATIIHGDATNTLLQSASFDLVYESTMFATLPDVGVRNAIAAEMLRVCRPGGYLLLVDWKASVPWAHNYKALTRAEVRRIFEVGKTTRLVSVFKGALVPPIGRLLSEHAEPLYFMVAWVCPLLVGQVAYLLQKHAIPPPQS